ncbi:MAG: phosphate signaling complex protein PhoU [Pseudomonadota bacterium]
MDRVGVDNLNLNQHTSHRYNEELEDVRNRVLQMGGLVEQQVANGLKALLDVDSELGQEVLDTDHQVNGMEVEIDELCTQVLALRQPAASDLRLVLMVIKTITDLERIGDEAQKLGRVSVSLSTQPRRPAYYAELRHLGEHVKAVLRDTLDAFARMDVDAALRTAKQDGDIDREYDSLSRLLISHMMEDPREIRNILEVSWCARALERIGDHANNICEYVVYLVHGKDIRHTKGRPD